MSDEERPEGAASPHPVVELDVTGRVVSANAAARALAPDGDVPAMLPAGLDSLLAHCAEEGKDIGGIESQAGGRTLAWTMRCVTDAERVRLYGFDITPWKESENVLLRKDNLLRAVAKAARTILSAAVTELPFNDVLAHLGDATGVSRIYIFRNHVSADHELLASQIAEWTATGVEPTLDNPELQNVPYEAAGMGRWAAEFAEGRTIAGGVDDFPPEEQEMLRPQGILSLVATPIIVEGEPWGFIGFDDCTVGHRWSQAELDILRAAADMVATAIQRRDTLSALEESREQLRHAQRMEAIGRLAGGIAHDFNNILSGILGYSELLLSEFDKDHAAVEDLQEIRESALRAAGLTKQLLAFSKKQEIRPAAIDLGALIEGMHKLASRLLGEDVSIGTALDERAPPVWADHGQVEQIVLNLVVNARDAMPKGGRITVGAELADMPVAAMQRHGLDPGQQYVLLSVSDTGTGMDRETRDKAFEPFFTTKKSGTGMGLSIIYGIAQQSGGSAWINTARGQGTTVTVALPVARQQGDDGEEEVAMSTAELAGPETILVVEDDPVVRKITQRVLERTGYRVLVADDAGAGMKTLRSDPDIAMVISDIGLPDISGLDFIDSVKAEWPDLPTLLMSGFPGRRDVDDPTITPEFLPKPFTKEQLLREVRARLDD